MGKKKKRVTYKMSEIVRLNLCILNSQNVIITCKSVSFLCSLDNLLLKIVIITSFWKSRFKMAVILKRASFGLFHIFSHQGKDSKIP